MPALLTRTETGAVALVNRRYRRGAAGEVGDVDRDRGEAITLGLLGDQPLLHPCIARRVQGHDREAFAIQSPADHLAQSTGSAGHGGNALG